jgi:predicted ATPase
MICSILGVHLQHDKVQELGILFHRRTHGNPVFIAQFVDYIQHEGLLRREPETNKRVDAIGNETMVSESLVDVLELKVQRLSRNVQHTLKLASVLGFCFKLDDLSDVVFVMSSTRSSPSIASLASINHLSLREATKEGFIEKTSRPCEYRFLHDKLQSSFKSMVDECKSASRKLHRVVGETFIAREDPDSLYQAAMHLNVASASLEESNDERVKLA